MPLRRLQLTAAGRHAGRRLDETLTDWLSVELGLQVSRAKARKLVMAGVVKVNGRRVRIASEELPTGARIEASVDLEKLFGDAPARDVAFELTAGRILYEDDDLIVVDKPAGLPSHQTVDASRNNLAAATCRFLARRDGVVEPYLGIHQRLDRDTSGIVLFTKSKRVNGAVAELFSNHLVSKVYEALTARPMGRNAPRRLEQRWTVRNYLGRIGVRSKRAVYGAVRSEGDLAETTFRVIAEHPRGIRIEAIPKTGRTHQIRVHLAEYGLPILGDDLYGAAGSVAPRLMLHAAQLKFLHPLSHREIRVVSALPADFENCLRRIAK